MTTPQNMTPEMEQEIREQIKQEIAWRNVAMEADRLNEAIRGLNAAIAQNRAVFDSLSSTAAPAHSLTGAKAGPATLKVLQDLRARVFDATLTDLAARARLEAERIDTDPNALGHRSTDDGSDPGDGLGL